jgi:hypothetical protein
MKTCLECERRRGVDPPPPLVKNLEQGVEHLTEFELMPELRQLGMARFILEFRTTKRSRKSSNT